ncbi:MAG: TetR/AcrR family transcriptional regulator [Chloroflexales bacterium]|nr:TetR/AcrR family transcriptional regulator [Chloroflexales bacterium]
MTQNQRPIEDLRVRRTRKLLMQALIDLTIEKGFVALTVQEIADRAMVNRATFYRHYLDKYDLLDKYMDEVYALTESQAALSSSHVQGAESGTPTVGLVTMLTYVQRHADFYRVMLGEQGDPTFVQRIRQYSEQRLRSLLPESGAPLKPGSPPRELCLSYLAHAGVGVLTWWLHAEQAHPAEQVAAWLTQLNQQTIDDVLGDTARPTP